jgi:hypothetical protein
MAYPPNVSRRDLQRAGIINDGPEPECPDCQQYIEDREDHTEWCENQVGQERLLEQLAEDAQAQEYEPMMDR